MNLALTIVPFYNVQAPVGRGAGGATTDVMLVQYMLFHVCVQSSPHFGRNAGVFGPTSPPGIGPRALFPFTGIYTPELDEWILTFQRSANSRGYGRLVEDGKISRAPVGWGKRSKHRDSKWYTLQALNYIMYQKCEQPYTRLPDLSDIPAPLASDLKVVMTPEYEPDAVA